MPETTHDDALEQQIAYYQARAKEYDEWFMRQGRYDHGPDQNRQWWKEVDTLQAALAAFRPSGEVLEFASGTGWWTEQLLNHTDTLTALDASAEVIEINRQRVGVGRARYVQTNLFDWQPDRKYDVVFFSFWLSHVPPERFAPFWDLVRRALKPGGRVFFIDSLASSMGTAADQKLTPPGEVLNLRRLNDGREFTIVKIFYPPEELQRMLTEIGWDISVQHTDNFFLYGSGQRKGRE